MSNANSISMKLYLMIVLFLFLTPKIFGQENKPLNSNYLIEKGVSPRILDAAASALLQDGRFIKNVNIISEKMENLNLLIIKLSMIQNLNTVWILEQWLIVKM